MMIETERLVLRPYGNDDVNGLVRLLTDPIITETFMVPEFKSREEVQRLAKKLISFSSPDDASHLELGIYLDGELIGFVNDCGIDGDEIEIGYVIHPDHQGHGYATEAVRALISHLAGQGFSKIKAGYFEENHASRRVMEKCGMSDSDETEEEEYRGVVHNCRYMEINMT